MVTRILRMLLLLLLRRLLLATAAMHLEVEVSTQQQRHPDRREYAFSSRPNCGDVHIATMNE